MSSAILHPEVIDKYLLDDVESNRVVEIPLLESSGIRMSRFGAIPMKRQLGRWRLIMDLSSPSGQTSGQSVNDYISPSVLSPLHICGGCGCHRSEGGSGHSSGKIGY